MAYQWSMTSRCMDLPFARKTARGVACLLSSQIMSRDKG